MATIGCNFESDIPVQRVADLVQRLLDVASENGVALKYILLADTMAGGNTAVHQANAGVLREKHPGVEFALHLHDTAAWASQCLCRSRNGRDTLIPSVAGHGTLPVLRVVPEQPATYAPRTFVFVCHEMGIETGIDLDALIDCARPARTVSVTRCRAPSNPRRQPRSPACDAVSGTSIDVQTQLTTLL